MPKVNFVKKARKDYPDLGIKKGDSYFWWKFNFGPKMVSKTAPRRSQLTRSPFLSALYDLEDEINSFTPQEPSDIESLRDDVISQLEEMKSECENNLENIPEQLRESSQAGQQLQERIDALEQSISDMESISMETEFENDEDKETKIQEALEAMNDAFPSL